MKGSASPHVITDREGTCLGNSETRHIHIRDVHIRDTAHPHTWCAHTGHGTSTYVMCTYGTRHIHIRDVHIRDTAHPYMPTGFSCLIPLRAPCLHLLHILEWGSSRSGSSKRKGSFSNHLYVKSHNRALWLSWLLGNAPFFRANRGGQEEGTPWLAQPGSGSCHHTSGI